VIITTVKNSVLLKLATMTMVCLVIFGTTTLSYAQKPLTKAFSQDKSVIAAERFLKSIRTLKAPFVQATSNGGYARGNLYIKRPGNLRIDYDKPTSLQVYADGTWLIYIDEELKDVSQIPLAATPASFLLREEFSFSDGLTIENVEKKNRTLRITVARRGEEGSGSLTLILSESANAFRGWSVIDPQGVKTTVTLLSPTLNQPIAKEIFVFTPPDWAFPTDAGE
jgi:outer membrane lipoprotein-sorting protein